MGGTRIEIYFGSFSYFSKPNSKIGDNCTKEFNIVAVDYDPVEAYVYWTDQSFGINRVNLDGSNEEQLVIGKSNW